MPIEFDERPNVPRRALAATTLRQQREHLRLAASVLAKDGEAGGVASLADLVQAKSFKSDPAALSTSKRIVEPNAFVIGLATTLIQVAPISHRRDGRRGAGAQSELSPSFRLCPLT